MRYNKLVRDKIPQRIKDNGCMPVVHAASDEEYWTKLKEKLQEEVGEFIDNPSEEELADILEVIHAISKFRGITSEALEAKRRGKARERGAFRDRLILDSVD